MDDALTYVRYPFADGSGSITIATVRPATILADVAVAVHPDDPRYADAIGKEVVVPVVGRRVPVIADERVEPEFGSGALKITPGHDPIDFEIGRDHGLPDARPCIGPDGRDDRRGVRGARPGGGRRARRRRGCKEHGQLEKRESYRHSVGTCERCHSRIEPLVSPQWWCRDGRARRARRSRRSRRGASASTPRASTASRSSRSRTRPTGASRGSSGGATRSRSGRAPTATRRARGRRPRRAPSAARRELVARDRRPRHVVLVGALAVRDARLARARRPSSSATTRATSTSPRARSSASGRTG